MTRWRRSIRAGSLVITAVAALAAPGSAAAQPAPNAHPTGGVVVGGSASITQVPATTTVSQSTQRAAINWQSFDVGSSQSVQVNAPSAGAVTLMHVVGANPSQVAGRISSNGIVVITNVNGAAIEKGAQVNAASFVLSAPGAVTKKFMAGGAIVFSQAATPSATIANAGTIDARLGSVWLLGRKPRRSALAAPRPVSGHQGGLAGPAGRQGADLTNRDDLGARWQRSVHG